VWKQIAIAGACELVGRAASGEGIPAPVMVSSGGSGVGSQRAIKELAARVDELTMVCTAMWTLIEEKTTLTHEDLFAKVREIDMADGVEDGKMTRMVKKCPACGRTMSARHKKCLYCGALELRETPFEGI
jgi:ribosomal protein S27AE